MKNLNYNLIFQPEPEGGFTVTVPALPGCVSYGRNLEEAKRMATDAIRGNITSLKKHKESIPSDNNSFISSIQIKHSSSLKSLVHA